MYISMKNKENLFIREEPGNPEKLEVNLQSQFSSIHLSAIGLITAIFCSRLYMLLFLSRLVVCGS